MIYIGVILAIEVRKDSHANNNVPFFFPPDDSPDWTIFKPTVLLQDEPIVCLSLSFPGGWKIR